jgi:hypothetical protein
MKWRVKAKIEVELDLGEIDVPDGGTPTTRGTSPARQRPQLLFILERE